MRSELERFRPIGRNILSDVIREENKTASGIVITDSIEINTDKDLSVLTDKARIISVGNAVPEVKKDDIVKFNPYAGKAVKFGTEIYLILTEDVIYGVIEPK